MTTITQISAAPLTTPSTKQQKNYDDTSNFRPSQTNIDQLKAVRIFSEGSYLSREESKQFIVNYLRTTFRKLAELEGDPVEFLLSLVGRLKCRQIQKGNLLFQEAETQECLFFIIKGDVQLYGLKSADDKDKEVFWQKRVIQSEKESKYLSLLREGENSETHRKHWEKRIEQDENVLQYYKKKEDLELLQKIGVKSCFFEGQDLLLKRTQVISAGQTCCFNPNDTEQLAITKTPCVLAVIQHSVFTQMFIHYQQAKLFAFQHLKTFIPCWNVQELMIAASKVIICQPVIFQIIQPPNQAISTKYQEDKSYLNNMSLFLVKHGIVDVYWDYVSESQKGVQVGRLNEGDFFFFDESFKFEENSLSPIAVTKETVILFIKPSSLVLFPGQVIKQKIISQNSSILQTLQQALEKQQQKQNDLTSQSQSSETQNKAVLMQEHQNQNTKQTKIVHSPIMNKHKLFSISQSNQPFPKRDSDPLSSIISTSVSRICLSESQNSNISNKLLDIQFQINNDTNTQSPLKSHRQCVSQVSFDRKSLNLHSVHHNPLASSQLKEGGNSIQQMEACDISPTLSFITPRYHFDNQIEKIKEKNRNILSTNSSCSRLKPTIYSDDKISKTPQKETISKNRSYLTQLNQQIPSVTSATTERTSCPTSSRGSLPQVSDPNLMVPQSPNLNPSFLSLANNKTNNFQQLLIPVSSNNPEQTKGNLKSLRILQHQSRQPIQYRIQLNTFQRDQQQENVSDYQSIQTETFEKQQIKQLNYCIKRNEIQAKIRSISKLISEVKHPDDNKYSHRKSSLHTITTPQASNLIENSHSNFKANFNMNKNNL